jgi:hypothetical protein
MIKRPQIFAITALIYQLLEHQPAHGKPEMRCSRHPHPAGKPEPPNKNGLRSGGMERSVKPQPIIPCEIIRSGPIKVRPHFILYPAGCSAFIIIEGTWPAKRQAKKSAMPLRIRSSGRHPEQNLLIHIMPGFYLHFCADIPEFWF